eukprot:GHVO01052054.1.p1 GENE.GHVO01052054.1~~GHVO01052054.1.p1  ORF type:complete len:591 (-),score=81.28 GHVO01052054.1:172-1923(-)
MEMDETYVRNLVLSVCDLKQMGAIPSPRVAAAMVMKGHCLYLHGGAEHKCSYDDLHVMELEKTFWSLVNTSGFSKPTGRYGHTLHNHDDSLIIFGGMAEATEASDQTDFPAPPFFGTSTQRWQHRGEASNDMFILSLSTMVWKQIETSSNTPSPRGFHASSVIELRSQTPLFVVFGGSADSAMSLNGLLGDLHVFDLSCNEWNEVKEMGTRPTPRFGHKMCAVPNSEEVMLFGGADDGGGMFVLNLSDFSESSTVNWTKVNVGSTPPLSRSFHTLDPVGNRVIVMAGQTIYSDISDLYVYDHKEQRWAKPLYEGHLNLRAHSSAVLHDKLVVFGGARQRLGDSREAEGVLEIMGGTGEEFRSSKKLSLLSVLEIKDPSSENSQKFKVVSVGDSGVGKSCLLTRFVQDRWTDFHVATVGVDFKSLVTIVKSKVVTLQLWDTAGQERFSGVTGTYYRNADAFVLVYDATRRESFERIDAWIEQIKEHHELGTSTLKILIGNKHDLKEDVEVTENEGIEKAKKIGAIHVATSAKTAANVDSAFLTIAAKLAEMRKAAPTSLGAQPRGIALSNSAPAPGRGECCGGG